MRRDRRVALRGHVERDLVAQIRDARGAFFARASAECRHPAARRPPVSARRRRRAAPGRARGRGVVADTSAHSMRRQHAATTMRRATTGRHMLQGRRAMQRRRAEAQRGDHGLDSRACAPARSTSTRRSSLLTAGGAGRMPSTLRAAERARAAVDARRAARHTAAPRSRYSARQRRRQAAQARQRRTSDRTARTRGDLAGASAARGCACGRRLRRVGTGIGSVSDASR